MFSSAGTGAGKSKETLSHDVPDSGRWKYFVCISILDNYLVTKNNIRFKDLYAIINQLYASYLFKTIFKSFQNLKLK